MDVKITFLHVELEEKIYMKQPEGYIQEVKRNMMCLLNMFSIDLTSLPDSGTNGLTLS